MKRIYQVLSLLCPSCGGDMRILAFLTDPPVVQGPFAKSIFPTRESSRVSLVAGSIMSRRPNPA